MQSKHLSFLSVDIPFSHKKKWLKWITVILTSVFLLSIVSMVAITYKVQNVLTHPKRDQVFNIENLQYAYEEVDFVSLRGEVPLKGWFFSANSDKTIILVHGYSGNRLIGEYGKFLINHLVGHGYNAFVFDFRNHGVSGKALTTVGADEQYDLLAAVQKVKELKGEEEKIGIIGFSMGAATAILAAEKTDAIDALVADSAFSDLKTYLFRSLPIWTKLPAFPFNYIFQELAKVKDGLDVDTVSPIRSITRIDKPIFLIHGKNDHIIPVQNADKLYSKAKENNQNVKIWKTENADHIQSVKYYPKRYAWKVTAFFDEHLR